MSTWWARQLTSYCEENNFDLTNPLKETQACRDRTWRTTELNHYVLGSQSVFNGGRSGLNSIIYVNGGVICSMYSSYLISVLWTLLIATEGHSRSIVEMELGRERWLSWILGLLVWKVQQPDRWALEQTAWTTEMHSSQQKSLVLPAEISHRNPLYETPPTKTNRAIWSCDQVSQSLRY